jgi:hypothetical protein
VVETDWSELRYLREDDTIGVVHRLKNSVPAHILSRDDRAKGGRARAARPGSDAAAFSTSAAARSGSRRQRRLGELLRSERLETAEWADGII